MGAATVIPPCPAAISTELCNEAIAPWFQIEPVPRPGAGWATRMTSPSAVIAAPGARWIASVERRVMPLPGPVAVMAPCTSTAWMSLTLIGPVARMGPRAAIWLAPASVTAPVLVTTRRAALMGALAVTPPVPADSETSAAAALMPLAAAMVRLPAGPPAAS